VEALVVLRDSRGGADFARSSLSVDSGRRASGGAKSNSVPIGRFCMVPVAPVSKVIF
jgi:hypothetical protein